MDAEPRRDARFTDPFNCSARIDDYYADESRPAAERQAAAKALWARWNPALERYSQASAQDEWWDEFLARARSGRAVA